MRHNHIGHGYIKIVNIVNAEQAADCALCGGGCVPVYEILHVGGNFRGMSAALGYLALV
jgi:hypothetical protein